MEGNPNGDSSLLDKIHVNLLPSEVFFKFRKEIQGIRLGLNLELYNEPLNDFKAKLLVKPLADNQKWKFICSPLEQDVQVISKKIPITKFLCLQVGIGHSFEMNATGLKWKLTSNYFGDRISSVKNKTSVGLCPGVDFQFRWSVVLPEFSGGLGTDEALFNIKSGSLQLSVDRVESIFTLLPDKNHLNID